MPDSLPYHFDDSARAVVVNDPALPAPWINYLSNGSLHAFVSQAGGGCLWWKSPLNFRLTRYRGWQAPQDGPGFTLHVKPRDGGPAWCPTWMPARTPLESFEARHRPGVSEFRARRGAVSSQLRLFIAPDEDVLVWDISVSNHGEETVALDLFAYAELGLLEWKAEQEWGYYIRNMFKTWWDPELAAQNYLYHHQNHPRLRDIPLVFFASDAPVVAACGDRQAYLGPYRSEADPIAVELGRIEPKQCWCGDPCAALQTELSLAPGETRRIRHFLGALPGALGDFASVPARQRKLLTRLRDPDWADGQRAKLQSWWMEHLGAASCRLPDPDCSRQIETWTPVQCVHTARYSRSFSQHASGLRGYGFRDTAQDLLAIAPRRPEWARAEFRRLLEHQFEDGHVVHAYFPEERQAPWTSVHSDDHLWLPFVAHAIAAETGDLAFLREPVAWLADDARATSGEASVWAHLLKTSDFTESRLGSHGLPLILHSDWNDCIGRFARRKCGESVMAAQQYVVALDLLADLALALREFDTAAVLAVRREDMLRAINQHAWDGAWWRRAFDDEGAAVGSAQNRHGRIWVNSQSWAVIAGCGDEGQRLAGLDAVAAHLDTPRGVKKLHPSFPTYPEEMDAFVGYSLGCGENGAIFCHANTWVIQAEAILGRGNRAWSLFRRLVPHVALQETGLSRYQGEPYAYVSNLVGPENPRFGWANVAQVTGTAAWMDVVAWRHLLGLRPTIDGMIIDPCLPEDWPGFEATRLFRGCALHIKVRRRGPGAVGVGHLLLDGEVLHKGHTRQAYIPAAKIIGRARVDIEVDLMCDHVHAFCL